MRFCLQFNQNPILLDKVDEIKVPWMYRERLPDLLERYPKAFFVVQHMFGAKQLDWDEYEKWFDQCDGDIILCTNNINDCIIASEKDIPFYYGYPIQSYEDFNSFVALDPYYIIPGAPLFFNLEYVASKGIPLKIFPNVSNITLLPKLRPATGTWIRPEDIDYYDKFIECCEFITDNKEKERALYHVYAEDKEFIGPISLLIPELEEFHADNDLISSEHTIVRTYCKQKCESGERNCTICEDLLKISDPDKLRYLLEK